MAPPRSIEKPFACDRFLHNGPEPLTSPELTKIMVAGLVQRAFQTVNLLNQSGTIANEGQKHSDPASWRRRVAVISTSRLPLGTS